MTTWKGVHKGLGSTFTVIRVLLTCEGVGWKGVEQNVLISRQQSFNTHNVCHSWLCRISVLLCFSLYSNVMFNSITYGSVGILEVGGLGIVDETPTCFAFGFYERKDVQREPLLCVKYRFGLQATNCFIYLLLFFIINTLCLYCIKFFV